MARSEGKRTTFRNRMTGRSEMGLINGLTNGLEKPLKVTLESPIMNVQKKKTLGEKIAEWLPRRKPRFVKLREKYMGEKRFGELTLDEINEIKENLTGKELDDVEETLFRRLTIAELVLKHDVGSKRFFEDPEPALQEIEEEFRQGEELFNIHTPEFVPGFKKSVEKIKFRISLKNRVTSPVPKAQTRSSPQSTA